MTMVLVADRNAPEKAVNAGPEGLGRLASALPFMSVLGWRFPNEGRQRPSLVVRPAAPPVLRVVGGRGDMHPGWAPPPAPSPLSFGEAAADGPARDWAVAHQGTSTEIGQLEGRPAALEIG